MAIYTRYRLYRTVGGHDSLHACFYAARPIWLWLPAVLMLVAAALMAVA